VSLPYALAQEGLIRSPSFSMWIDDLESDRGSILFGGVNTAHYSGVLSADSFFPFHGFSYGIFMIPQNYGLNLQDGSGTLSHYMAGSWVYLDIGSRLSYIIDETVVDIYNRLNITYDEEQNMGFVPCDWRQKDYTFSLTFDSTLIQAPMADMVLDWNSSTTCVFGIQPGGDPENANWRIGSSFLRSSYLVLDYDGSTFAVAPRNPNPGEDHILEIGWSIPSAVVSSLPPPTYTPTPSSTLSATSTGQATQPTNDFKHLVAGLAGAGLLAVL
jgi:hypothetical protein